MMQIQIGGSLILVYPGIKLPLVLRSPLFATAEGRLPGSYIFNTSFPASDALMNEFSQAHRIQKEGRSTAELPYVIRHGSLRFQGNCIVTRASEKEYDIAFKIDNGDFASIIKEKSLKHLDLGGDIAIASIYSFATTKPEFYTMDRVGSFTLPVEGPDTIQADFSGSFSDTGKIFTASQSASCTLKVSVQAFVQVGYLQLTVKMNGTTILSETFTSFNSFHNVTFSQNLDLSAGDVVTVSLICVSSEFEFGESVNINLRAFTVEYGSENVFNACVTKDQYSSDFVVFPVHNAELLSNFPDDAFQLDNISIKTLYSEYFPIQNYYRDGCFPIFMSGELEGESFCALNLFTPFVYLRTLLLKIIQEAGYTTLNTPFDSVNFSNMVLFNAYAENTYASSETTLLPVKASFNLSDHVPDISQPDFINWVCKLTGFVPLVNNNEKSVTFFDLKDCNLETTANPSVPFPGILIPESEVTTEPEYNGLSFELIKASTDKYLERSIRELHEKLVYKGEVERLTNLPPSGNKVNDMYLATKYNEYYVFQYNPEVYALTWWFYSKKFPLKYEEGNEPFLEVSTQFSPVLSSYMDDTVPGAPEGRFWWLPRTEQAGILEGFPESLSSECGIQVLKYAGMVNDSQGHPYPFGSCRYAEYGSRNPVDHLDFNADSIFALRYKGFLQWLCYNTKLVTLKVILTSKDLQNINFGKIYRLGGISFLIKEIKVNVELENISITQMDIFVI
jgi:hypothetical protein